MNYKEQSISIIKLHVNPENPRFNFVNSHKEALDVMISREKGKLYNLAEHIVKFGLNPSEKIIVVKSAESNTYTVLEGNRRITALKILYQPDLIEGDEFKTLKKKFKKLSESSISNIPIKVPCVVFDNAKDAEIWIGIKHKGEQDGVGLNKWDATQIGRFELKTSGKSRVSLEFINLIRNLSFVSDEFKTDIISIKSTNVDRLLADNYVRNKIGININNNKISISEDRNSDEVYKNLLIVAKDLLSKDFNVKLIYKKEDRQRYIDSIEKKIESYGESLKEITNITSNYKPDATTSGHIQANSNDADNKINSSRKETKSKSVLLSRSTLINADKSNIEISNSRIAEIYTELTVLPFKKYNNAAGVLFRVFTELSIDYYLEKMGLLESITAQKSNKALQAKVNEVINNLSNKNKIDSAVSKGIKLSVNNTSSIFGVDTWHSYVHNHRISPDPDVLARNWDSMEEFFRILWNELK